MVLAGGLSGFVLLAPAHEVGCVAPPRLCPRALPVGESTKPRAVHCEDCRDRSTLEGSPRENARTRAKPG